MIHAMSSRDPEQILQTARTNLARVIDQLERDRASLAGRPQYLIGERKLATAKAVADRLVPTLRIPEPS
jgi:hypothetical protein